MTGEEALAQVIAETRAVKRPKVKRKPDRRPFSYGVPAWPTAEKVNPFTVDKPEQDAR